MKNRILIFFLVIGIGELVAVVFQLEQLEWLCKPLIMILLGVYYYYSVKNDSSLFSKPVMAAIVFSWGGDIALMLLPINELYFMLGLGFFLLAHLSYIMGYRQHKMTNTAGSLLGIQKFRFALPIVLAGTGLITILYSHLGDLKIPVIVYALVLIVMVMQALFRFGYTNQKSFWLVFVGAVMFMISDSSIAINKFLSNFESSGLIIMSTYMIAQLLIILGLIAHHEK